jgi:hypothetical protein
MSEGVLHGTESIAPKAAFQSPFLDPQKLTNQTFGECVSKVCLAEPNPLGVESLIYVLRMTLGNRKVLFQKRLHFLARQGFG